MEHRDPFSACHPLVALTYFALILVQSMFVMHPVSLLLSLVCAVMYSVSLRGTRAVRFQVRYLLPLALAAAVLNPAFNHRGATILAYLPSGNPLTLESIAYGGAAALMLAAVVTWFSCCTAVMTADKFVYLFGRVASSLSLLLSMTLRFLPQCKARYQAVREAQEGLSTPESGLFGRAKGAAKTISITVTWSLEQAIDTADSMKSRGYGLPGRTAYSIYRLDGRDGLLLAWLLVSGGVSIWGWAAGHLDWRWFPTIRGEFTTATAVCFASYSLLCLTPLILRWKEERTWKRLRSEI